MSAFPYGFMATTISYPLIQKCLKDRRVQLGIGCFLMCLGATLFGPARFLPNLVPVIFSGMVIIGLGSPFIIIPMVPMCIDAFSEKYHFMTDSVKDRISSLLVFGYTISSVIGPVYGNTLYYAMSWSFCCEILASLYLL